MIKKQYTKMLWTIVQSLKKVQSSNSTKIIITSLSLVSTGVTIHYKYNTPSHKNM